MWEKTLEIISYFLNHRNIEIWNSVVQSYFLLTSFNFFKKCFIYLFFITIYSPYTLSHPLPQFSNGCWSFSALYCLLISLPEKQRADLGEPELSEFPRDNEQHCSVSLHLLVRLPSVLACDCGFHSW